MSEETGVPPAAAAPTLIASFDKGLRILDLIVHAQQPLRLQDVADALAIDKSSALRFLATLQKHALVRRHAADKTFSPGARLGLWSRGLGAQTRLTERIAPHLHGLVADTGQTAHLALLSGEGVRLVEVAPGPGDLAVRQTPGDWEPLYCSAVGKALLAYLPTAEQRRLIDRIEFREFTANTLSSATMLQVALRDVVHAGVAFDEAENHPDIHCIAAPIRDRSGFPLAAIGLSAHRRDGSPGVRARPDWIRAVQQWARRITADLLG